MDSKIEAAINAQINQEFTAAYSYLGMSAYFEMDSLTGFAHWCRLQHEEEMAHANRLFKYLLDRGGKVELEAIPKPSTDYEDAVTVFRTALSQEENNTKSINELYQLAASINDHATISHLQWFLDEQVEEEALVGEVLSLVERAKDEFSALLYLNDKLGARKPEEEGEEEGEA